MLLMTDYHHFGLVRYHLGKLSDWLKLEVQKVIIMEASDWSKVEVQKVIIYNFHHFKSFTLNNPRGMPQIDCQQFYY